MKKKNSDEKLPGSKNVASVFQRQQEILHNVPTRLFLMRHGELTTSREWRYVGHLDVELNAAGIRQIQTMSARLKPEPLDVIVSSDLKRTVKSAEIIAAARGITPRSYPEFREINLGCWEGKTLDEIAAEYPHDLNERSAHIASFRVKDGESFQDVHRRVIPALENLLDRYEHKNILLVAHGGVNRVILCHVLGMDLNDLDRFDQAYGCLNIIEFYNGSPVVKLLNSTAP